MPPVFPLLHVYLHFSCNRALRFHLRLARILYLAYPAPGRLDQQTLDATKAAEESAAAQSNAEIEAEAARLAKRAAEVRCVYAGSYLVRSKFASFACGGE